MPLYKQEIVEIAKGSILVAEIEERLKSLMRRIEKLERERRRRRRSQL